MEEIEIADESLNIEGTLSLYELPRDMSDEEFRAWWEPETALGEDGLYHIVRPARCSDEEKARRKVLEVGNLITNAGIKQQLNNMSVPGQGLLLVFNQIFALGNGAISGVTRADTAVAGDGFATGSRKQAASVIVIGYTTTATMNYASGDANGTITNAGIFGVNPVTGANAGTSAGTGTLMTHVLFNFVKGASAVAIAYSISLAN